MKAYQKRLTDGFAQRSFSCEQIETAEELPWWLVERWSLHSKHAQLHSTTFYLHFMNDLFWENGPKRTVSVLLSTQKLEGYREQSLGIASLSLNQGNFDDELKSFWLALEDFLKD